MVGCLLTLVSRYPEVVNTFSKAGTGAIIEGTSIQKQELSIAIANDPALIEISKCERTTADKVSRSATEQAETLGPPGGVLNYSSWSRSERRTRRKLRRLKLLYFHR